MRTGALEGQLGMDAAMERVADTEWLGRARRAVASLCQVGMPFTSDDVVAIAGDPPGSGNVVGALMRAIAREGWIRDTGSTTHSRRPEAHRRKLSIWRSAS